MDRTEGALSEVLDELREATPDDGDDSIAVGQLVDALDARGYGPALAVLPLIELTPIGGIPGVPTLLAAMLAVLAIRLLLGHEHFWVPGWIRDRTLKARRVTGSLDWLKPVAKRIDARLHERLRPLTGPTARRAALLTILALLAMVPPLELVPFATSAPMIAVSAFGLALLFRDGLLMLFGFLAAAIAVPIGFGTLAMAGGLI